jgi:hypothetical protein
MVGSVLINPTLKHAADCFVTLRTWHQSAGGVNHLYGFGQRIVLVYCQLIRHSTLRRCNLMNMRLMIADLLMTSSESNSSIQSRIFSVIELWGKVPGIRLPCGSIIFNASVSVSYLWLVGLALVTIDLLLSKVD